MRPIRTFCEPEAMTSFYAELFDLASLDEEGSGAPTCGTCWLVSLSIGENHSHEYPSDYWWPDSPMVESNLLLHSMANDYDSAYHAIVPTPSPEEVDPDTKPKAPAKHEALAEEVFYHTDYFFKSDQDCSVLPIYTPSEPRTIEDCRRRARCARSSRQATTKLRRYSTCQTTSLGICGAPIQQCFEVPSTSTVRLCSWPTTSDTGKDRRLRTIFIVC